MIAPSRPAADTLGTLLKYQDDIAHIQIQGTEAERLLAEVEAELATP